MICAGRCEALRISVFDDAQLEVYSLMRDNAYISFLKSPFCARSSVVCIGQRCYSARRQRRHTSMLCHGRCTCRALASTCLDCAPRLK